MDSLFIQGLIIIRRRVLAFTAVFFAAGLGFALLAFAVSDAKSDPGPVVYLFAPLFGLILGTLPVLTYFLNRWVPHLGLQNCPHCGKFMWLTAIQAIIIAVLNRCPCCLKSFRGLKSEG